jgi:opacity protein-like surface antigen
MKIMRATKTKILAGTAALVLAGSASSLQAQLYNYYYGSPNPGAQASPAPHDAYVSPFNDKLYLGFDAGVALQQDVTISDSIGDSEKITFSPGARLDMMLGWQFTKRFAAEFELGFVANKVSHSYALGTDYTDVTYLQLPMLVNGIYTLPLNKSETCLVYFGAGIGGVFSKYMDDYGDETPGDSAFAYQAQAGIKWAVGRRCDLGLAYKFLGSTGHDLGSGWDSNGDPTAFTSDGTMSHSILATFTVRF